MNRNEPNENDDPEEIGLDEEADFDAESLRPLEGELLVTARRAYERLEAVLPVEFEEWAEAFQADPDMVEEIGLWDRISLAYEGAVTRWPELDLAQKDRVLRVLVECSVQSRDEVLDEFPGDYFLSREQVARIVGDWFS